MELFKSCKGWSDGSILRSVVQTSLYISSQEQNMATNQKDPRNLIERAIDGVLHLLPATVSIKLSDLRGGKMSWEFVHVPASSPNGNPPTD